MDAEKTYRFTARWGEARDSDDAEGKVTATSDVRPVRDEIEAVLPRFHRRHYRRFRPIYSAIKVQGERAYDLAREGETVVLEPRPIQVHEARLLDQPDAAPCRVRNPLRQRDLRPGLGARYRAAHWALWAMFRRFAGPAVGGFSVEDAISLDKLSSFMHSPAAFEHLRPISTALDGIPALAVTGPDAVRLRSGNPILMRANLFASIVEEAGARDDLQGLTVFLSTAGGEPVALAELAEGELRPFRVFNFGTG